MKIINIVTQMEAAGAQGAAIRMTKELISRGIEAETWFLHCKSDVYGDLPYVRTLFKQKAGVLSVFKIFVILFTELKKAGPNCIITYTHDANILGSIAGRLAGEERCIATQRNPSNTYPNIARLLDKILGSFSLYQHNICTSKHVFESFRHYPKKYIQKLGVIYNGIDFKPSSLTKKQARGKFNLPESTFLIITSGRLASQKNHRMLIDVAQKLGRQFSIAIAGEGTLRKNIEEQIKSLDLEESIFLLGELHSSSVPDFLACGDLFVFPSKFEAFGFSMVEAMAAGMPVIASNIPSLEYIIDDAGLVLDIQNKDEWVQRITEVKEDTKLRDSLSNKAMQRAQYFSLQKMTDAYLKLAVNN